MENKNKGSFWGRFLMFLLVSSPFIIMRACNEEKKAEKRQYEQTQEWIQRDLDKQKREWDESGMSVEQRKEELSRKLNGGNSVETNSNGSVDSTADIQSQNGVETKDR